MLRWCTICQVFVRWPVLLSWVGDHVLLLISEEHSEVSVGSSVCWVLLYPREFTAVSEGGVFPRPVWWQHYSGKLDLPAVLASCAHPCGWDNAGSASLCQEDLISAQATGGPDHSWEMETVLEPDPGFLPDFGAFPPVFVEEAEDTGWKALVRLSAVESSSSGSVGNAVVSCMAEPSLPVVVEGFCLWGAEAFLSLGWDSPALHFHPFFSLLSQSPLNRCELRVCICAKLLQSCPTLCDPVDCSPSGSSVHGLLQETQ